MRKVILRREARSDALGAFRWYEDRSRGLGIEFRNAIDSAIESIAQHPEAAAQIAGQHDGEDRDDDVDNGLHGRRTLTAIRDTVEVRPASFQAPPGSPYAFGRRLRRRRRDPGLTFTPSAV